MPGLTVTAARSGYHRSARRVTSLIAPPPGHELVAKTDAIVGGVHFLHDDPPDLIARTALRVNLSDLAAKGAVARAYMLDVMLPKTVARSGLPPSLF